MAKKKSTSKKDELKQEVSSLRGELTKAEAKLSKKTKKVEALKEEAKVQRATAAKAGTRAKKLQKKLDRASEALEPVADAVAEPSAEAVTQPAGAGTSAVPDETWTVAQLRAEARARGLVGMSGKPKAALIDALG